MMHEHTVTASLHYERLRRKDSGHPETLADAGRRALIELYCNGSAPTDAYAAMPPAQLHVAFSSTDPDIDAARLVDAGAVRIDHVRYDDGAYLVMLRDPWGLPIQLARRSTPMI